MHFFHIFKNFQLPFIYHFSFLLYLFIKFIFTPPPIVSILCTFYTIIFLCILLVFLDFSYIISIAIFLLFSSITSAF